MRVWRAGDRWHHYVRWLLSTSVDPTFRQMDTWQRAGGLDAALRLADSVSRHIVKVLCAELDAGEHVADSTLLRQPGPPGELRLLRVLSFSRRTA